MNSEKAIRILKPLMWKIGKSDGEQLWAHQFTVWYLLKQMIESEALPALNDEKQELIELACLLHDLKKGTPWNQLILSNEPDVERGISVYKEWWGSKGVKLEDKELNKIKGLFESRRTDHQIETERDFEYFLKPYLEHVKGELLFAPSEEKARMLFDIMKHHFLTEKDISTALLPGFGNYLYMLKLCDRMASVKTIDVKLINELRRINLLGRQIFDVTYFTVSRNYGPSTALALNVVTKAYNDNGWYPLLYLEEGGIFIAKGKGRIPEKENIIQEIFRIFTEKSIEINPVQPGRKTMLTGIAEDHPKEFLLSHRDEFLRDLDSSEGGGLFFKVLIEILTNAGFKNVKFRKEYPILDVLFSLTGGTRGIPLALRKWEEYKKRPLPVKEKGGIDKRNALNLIFNSVSLDEIIPVKITNKLSINIVPLKDYPTKELFDILVQLAASFDKETGRDLRLKDFLNNIISMEEEKDFKAIAQERFEGYKNYKRRPQDASSGACEICGCTVTQKPGADFPGGQIQAFTQIKARPDIPRKICPFCAYDNSVMRHGVGNYVPIYLKTHSRVSLPYRKELKEQIKLLRDGLIRIEEIINMRERWGILFPDVDIVIGTSNFDITSFSSMETEQEMMFRLESVDPKEYSPKDIKVKYEPLYHLLRLIGFQASIGREEQIGLFSDNPLTTETAYHRSLSAVLLSSTLGDKSKKYIMAKDLLEKSPSVAISHCASEDKDRKGKRWLRLKENIAKPFFKYLAKSDIKIFKNGGDYSMKDLLQHAAFFADKEKGIGHFCIEPEKRGDFWNPINMTRHNTAKPVADALDEITQGREMDLVIERFMRNIAKKIGQDEQDKLADFVKGAKEIFRKYHNLRKEDVSKFIRVKNALTSAIYVFTRYEKLKIKEVIE